MPSLGPAEILVVLVIALLVFGPDKMPDMARSAGRAFREFRRVQSHVRSEIHGAIGDLDSTKSAGPTTSATSGDPVPTLPPQDPSASATPATADTPPSASDGPASDGATANPPSSSPPADPA